MSQLWCALCDLCLTWSMILQVLFRQPYMAELFIRMSFVSFCLHKPAEV